MLVLLGGASGVGKTRLVSEFEQRLARAGCCCTATASSRAMASCPYAPLLSALRPLVRERHPALAGAQPRQPCAARGAAAEPREDATVEHFDVEAAGQVRLFEALLELLHLLSESRGVVVVLEDMHWADRSTRTFAAFLARSLRQERVMLLLSYRTDELHRRHPLRPLLTELDRLERARTIELAPFDRDELREALLDILGQAPSEQLIDRLLTRSEGNPLYVEELLAAGLDGRGAAPQSLSDAFMLRIERLSPDASAWHASSRSVAAAASRRSPR